MTNIFTADTAHQVQVPLMTKSSMMVNQETKQIPKRAMASMNFKKVISLVVDR